MNIQIVKLEKTIKDDKDRALRILEKSNSLEKELSLLEEASEMQEYGFYKTRYQFEDSKIYKEKLDEIKARQKNMIKDKTATHCTTEWEVQGSKSKGKAMTNDTFKVMLRAFNGESDAAISKVKYSNVHVMKKRIDKSFEMINKLNKRNHAFIVDAYLDLKLEELYLTHEFHEKVQEEKEEQRQIREQMREEERAQKEFEKAKLEAEKEEERARQALEKAKNQLETAHGQKLEKLKVQMILLENRLKEAEENNQRATSMAQMTKSGYVYIISNIGSLGKEIYKIGMTRRLEPMDRVRELSSASVPFEFDVHAMIYTENAPGLENQLHKEFHDLRVNKINYRKEFFNVSLEKIRRAVEKLHGEFKLTKLAEARQYRETIALLQKNVNEEVTLKREEVKVKSILSI